MGNSIYSSYKKNKNHKNLNDIERYVPDKINFKSLEGISYIQLLDKNIFIFGESHFKIDGQEEEFQYFLNFLNNLIIKNKNIDNECLDIIIEDTISKIKIGNVIEQVKSIQNQKQGNVDFNDKTTLVILREHLDKLKKKKLRIHYVDTRISFKNNSIKTKLIYFLIQISKLKPVKDKIQKLFEDKINERNQNRNHITINIFDISEEILLFVYNIYPQKNSMYLSNIWKFFLYLYILDFGLIYPKFLKEFKNNLDNLNVNNKYHIEIDNLLLIFFENICNFVFYKINEKKLINKTDYDLILNYNKSFYTCFNIISKLDLSGLTLKDTYEFFSKKNYDCFNIISKLDLRRLNIKDTYEFLSKNQRIQDYDKNYDKKFELQIEKLDTEFFEKLLTNSDNKVSILNYYDFYKNNKKYTKKFMNFNTFLEYLKGIEHKEDKNRFIFMNIIFPVFITNDRYISTFFDINNILRIFHKFDIKNENRVCNKQETMKNIILYCGNVHRINFLNFIKNFNLNTKSFNNNSINTKIDYFNYNKKITDKKLNFNLNRPMN